MKRAFAVIVALILALGAAVAAEAATLTLWPDQLLPYGKGTTQFRGPGGLKSAGTETYAAALKLPAGASLVKVIVTFSSAGPGLGFPTHLWRVKSGLPAELLMNFLAYGDTGGNTSNIESAPTDFVGDKIVRKGYRYYLEIAPDSNWGTIYCIRVVYR